MDSLSYLIQVHGHEKLADMITKHAETDKYSVNYKTGKIIKKRKRVSKPDS